ncbi:MAG TPA: M28 family peptidase [Longimicrobiaceae bacterium]|nr:M28 family peptidase [Longimicrobiaceae bacterium]
MSPRTPARLLLPLLALGAWPAAAAAQPSAARITAAEIDGHLRFLASDLLEGRAPATRGGRLTAEYIASQLRSAGVEPAGTGGDYFQTVPIDVVGADRSTLRATVSGRASGELRYPEDVVVWAGSAADESRASGELVFVGYGSAAPEYRWDDFKDVDVRGKVLLVLVNDPPAPAAEPNHFGGRAMTYYGRWTYKFEEAERRGAAGMLIVHTTERAGYGWPTVVGSWAREQRMLPRDPRLPAPLGVRGWITDSAATALLGRAGLDLAALRERAARRDFRPVATGISVDLSFRNRVEHLESENVIGVIRGSDPALRDEHVAFTAHWDHLGIGPPMDGDSIYNGALDNASGVADVLAVARAAAALPAPRRSLLFVFVTAEESGLLGSEYFARNPVVPIERIVANLNVDGGNLLGRSLDFRVLGDTKSTLGPMLAAQLARQGWTVSPDAFPERGAFYRSDHFSFARAGVPAVSIAAGVEYEGRPAGWGAAQQEEYTTRRYHQPGDEYRRDFDLAGAVQLAEVVLEFGRSLANAATVPEWNADAEFRAARPPRGSTR